MIYFRYLADAQRYRDKYQKGYAIRFDSEKHMYYVSPF